MKSKITVIILLGIIVTVISGCLLTRLHQTQKQVCTGKTRLEMTREGLRVIFEQPLLTKEDIIAILGAETGRAETGDMNLVYTARNKNDVIHSFPVVFGFRHDGKEDKLTRVSIGKRFQDFLGEELLKTIFNAGCSARRNGFGIEVDLSQVPSDMLPNIDVVKELLGKPVSASNSTAVFLYDINDRDTAEISISFSGKTQSLISAGISFQRYSLVFDFENGVAVGKLKNLSDAVRLGVRP